MRPENRLFSIFTDEREGYEYFMYVYVIFLAMYL